MQFFITLIVVAFLVGGAIISTNGLVEEQKFRNVVMQETEIAVEKCFSKGNTYLYCLSK